MSNGHTDALDGVCTLLMETLIFEEVCLAHVFGVELLHKVWVDREDVFEKDTTYVELALLQEFDPSFTYDLDMIFSNTVVFGNWLDLFILVT